jgi:hypothetical protein
MRTQNRGVLSTEVEAVVSSNHMISDESPFPRAIELLVDPTVEAECGLTYNTAELEIVEPIGKGV